MPSGVYIRTEKYRKEISKRNKRLGIKWPGTLGLHWKLSDKNKENQSKAQTGKKCPWANPPHYKGKDHYHWKGGKFVDSRGYYLIYKPKHPFSRKAGYIRLSRLVAEKCLGRYLTKWEVIHHINGNTLDDRPKNLYLFSSNSKHRKYHSNTYPLKSNLID